VLPLYESWKQYFSDGEIDGHVSNIIKNKEYWKDVSENRIQSERIKLPEIHVAPLKVQRKFKMDTAELTSFEEAENDKTENDKEGKVLVFFRRLTGKKKRIQSPSVIIEQSADSSPVKGGSSDNSATSLNPKNEFLLIDNKKATVRLRRRSTDRK
jgi:hypothetical protein